MYKTTLYSNNEGSPKKSKYLRKLHKKYDTCLKNTCWRRLSKTDYKLSIGKISRQLPNMFNNSNGCYINSLLQLLFRLDEFNEQILGLSYEDLHRIDKACISNYLIIKNY